MGGVGRREGESDRTKQALHGCFMARSISSNTPICISLARTQSYSSPHIPGK